MDHPALAASYDGTILDLDGTVHRSGTLIPGVLEALAESSQRYGMQHVFVTNNASRTPEELAADLHGLGIEVEADHVFTSAQAAARLLVDRVPAGSPVLAVGGSGVRAALEAAGFRLVERSDTGRPVAVVQGWFPDLAWRLLAEGAFALAAGALWVATNLDATLPTHRGLAPGNGSFVRVLAATTGREPDLVAGKPGPGILLEAAAVLGLRRALVVGDRLDTDIEGARAAGLDSLLVLTGVTDVWQLLQAPVSRRPTYVGAGLDALLRPTSLPVIVDGVVTCGAASVVRGSDGVLDLHAAGDRLDLLHASCVAAWSEDAAQVRLSGPLAAALGVSVQG
ncbi:MAG TPA: HAD-IIA family hydrolase [Actinomycetes bacterium]|nr:HAD-IIA family hydrolase [Actinomycetes bacterium]